MALFGNKKKAKAILSHYSEALANKGECDDCVHYDRGKSYCKVRKRSVSYNSTCVDWRRK